MVLLVSKKEKKLKQVWNFRFFYFCYFYQYTMCLPTLLNILTFRNTLHYKTFCWLMNWSILRMPLIIYLANKADKSGKSDNTDNRDSVSNFENYAGFTNSHVYALNSVVEVVISAGYIRRRLILLFNGHFYLLTPLSLVKKHACTLRIDYHRWFYWWGSLLTVQ